MPRRTSSGWSQGGGKLIPEKKKKSKVKPLNAAVVVGSLAAVGVLAIPAAADRAIASFATCDLATSGESWVAKMSQAAPTLEGTGIEVSDVAGPALGAAIRISKWKARRGGARPLPRYVRERLSGHFPAEMLSRVRWVSLERELLDVSFREACLEGTGALTLDDTIIFSSERAATDLHLWAHELTHVSQFRRLGVEGFAEAYSTDPSGLERHAEATAQQLMSSLRRPMLQASAGSDGDLH